LLRRRKGGRSQVHIQGENVGVDKPPENANFLFPKGEGAYDFQGGDGALLGEKIGRYVRTARTSHEKKSFMLRKEKGCNGEGERSTRHGKKRKWGFGKKVFLIKSWKPVAKKKPWLGGRGKKGCAI